VKKLNLIKLKFVRYLNENGTQYFRVKNNDWRSELCAVKNIKKNREKMK